MKVETVRLVKTLKAGKNVWIEGDVLETPLPSDILEEIRRNTGTVEILTVGEAPKADIPKVIMAVPEFKDDIGNKPISTLTTTRIKRAKRTK